MYSDNRLKITQNGLIRRGKVFSDDIEIVEVEHQESVEIARREERGVKKRERSLCGYSSYLYLGRCVSWAVMPCDGSVFTIVTPRHVPGLEWLRAGLAAESPLAIPNPFTLLPPAAHSPAGYRCDPRLDVPVVYSRDMGVLVSELLDRILGMGVGGGGDLADAREEGS
ncbi:hypothetical protein Tco_1317679 [Tanacetum coccineum]